MKDTVVPPYIPISKEIFNPKYRFDLHARQLQFLLLGLYVTDNGERYFLKGKIKELYELMNKKDPIKRTSFNRNLFDLRNKGLYKTFQPQNGLLWFERFDEKLIDVTDNGAKLPILGDGVSIFKKGFDICRWVESAFENKEGFKDISVHTRVLRRTTHQDLVKKIGMNRFSDFAQ